MRTRAGVAAVAGISAAALARVLDASGQLPFVHETTTIRAGMGAEATLAWLVAAGALAALAATTRAVAVGSPAAVAISAFPELWSRHDPGAIGEPGALLGALLQLLLLLAVVSTALLFADRLVPSAAPVRISLARPPTPLGSRRPALRRHPGTTRSRAPPRRLLVRDMST